MGVAESVDAHEVVDEQSHDGAILGARRQVRKEEFALTAGRDAVSVGNADRCGRCTVVAGGDWSSAVTVVVARSGVSNGGEVRINVIRRCWWATGCISCINCTIYETSI